jgi:AcrR family transcriptional regulator
MTATSSGRRRGRPPKSDAGDTKELLLQAALALFADKGFEGTSVRDIARSVGLSESVLYAHFSSKRAIFDAVFERLGPLSASAALNGLGDQDADPPGFLRALITREMTEWSTPAARQLISLMSHDNMLHSTDLRGGIAASLGSLAELFGRWMADGIMNQDLGSAHDLAYALMAPVALTRVLWLHDRATPQEIDAAREQAARHAELFIKAVLLPRPAAASDHGP